MKVGDEVVGNRLSIAATKNKVATPFRVAEIDLYFAKGIDTLGDIMDLAAEKGITTKSGANYFFGDLKLGFGRDAAKEFLDKDPKTFKLIKDALSAEGKIKK